jgi:hypothetical protein
MGSSRFGSGSGKLDRSSSTNHTEKSISIFCPEAGLAKKNWVFTGCAYVGLGQPIGPMAKIAQISLGARLYLKKFFFNFLDFIDTLYTRA